jgi:DNA-binding LytR/AlgR family response regulator
MNILIVEDEHLVATNLQYMLNGFGYQADFMAANYADAVKILQTQDIHLAFLDINLIGHKTGIDVAEYIRDNTNIPFIFLTSYDDMVTVNAALKTLPHAYLSKPFHKATIYSAVELALKKFRQLSVTNSSDQSEDEDEDATVIKEALFIKEKDLFSKILLTDILYIRSDNNYLELHTTQKKYIIRETLKNIMSQFPKDSFFRTHKSFIINLKAITAINHLYVLIGQIEIPIAPDNRSELLSKLKTFS